VVPPLGFLVEKKPSTPLVNIQKIMENHHLSMAKSTISMAIFNSYVNLPEGKVFKKF